MVELNLRDIQGNVLLGYKHRHVLHLFGQVKGKDGAEAQRWRQFLSTLTPRITRAQWSEPPEATLNLGLSHRALAALQPLLAREVAARFPAFAAGMSKRAQFLGDNGKFQRAAWEARDVWVIIYAQDEAWLQATANEVQGLARDLGLELGAELRGEAIDKSGARYEHFGFRDDISYPAFEGIPGLLQEDIDGRGKLTNGRWVALKTGEFLFGYASESEEAPLADLSEGAQLLLRNGTFGVFRHLQQHVAEFRRYLRNVPGDEDDYLAERMMGRKKDGTPLVPVTPGASGRAALSSFDYGSDPKGAKCPLGSHVRRTNPRLEDGRHRLIRRGMPFGKELAPGAEEREPLGLLFVAFNADIETQFEFVQRAWCNGVVVNNVPDARDPIGSTVVPRSLMIEGDVATARPPRPLMNIPELVTCLGGEYFFYPGIGGLQSLLAEHPQSSPPSGVRHT